MLSNEVLIPRVIWAQRKDVVYLTIEVFEVKDENIEIQGNTVVFSGVRGSDEAKFGVSLELYGEIDANKSKINVGHRDISLVLAKVEEGPFWPRLLKSTQKKHYIHTDFSKWVDEDEEDEPLEPSGMGNFDMSQFGGAGANFDMSQFSGGNEDFDDSEYNDEENDNQNNCQDEDCSHDHDQESVKISGLTKDNSSFDS
jgi:cytosolic prostaglandin-E synthase